MGKERIVWIVALLVVAGAAFYGGQQFGVMRGRQERAQAASTFFGGRGGQATAGGFAGRGVNGTVSAISGNSITITARDGSTVTVQLAQGGVVRKQTEGQLSDIKTGDVVTAIGTRNGDTITASAIQIGGGFGGAPGAQGGPNQGAGANNGRGQNPRPTQP
ncbi:MAG TPA: hypothetical protein VFT99_05685 [Roseiflexaceae bacterium]|nr:hypothetical protein [Roseiflexaceae bacterium]